MMKKFSKTIAIILSLLLVMSLCSCFEVDLDEDVKDGTDIEISTPDYGFVAKEEFSPNVSNPLEGTVKYFENGKSFEVGTTYYLIITFSVTPRSDNAGQMYFKTSAKFDNLDILDATMQQADTSMTSVEIEHNMKENVITRNVEASFKVPASTTDVKNYIMIVRMVPNKVSDKNGVKIEIEFSLDNTAYTIYGAGDGFTTRIDIEKGTLTPPELVYNTSNMNLEWNHVKNASYYVVYADGNPIEFTQGETTSEKIYATGDIKVGDTMEAILLNSNLQEGYRELKIKAFGPNGALDESFYSSQFSNIVGIDW